MKRAPRKSGFTIVELLIVIAVIAILASISVVGYGQWQQRIAKQAVTSDLLGAASAFKSKLNFDNKYPTSFDGIFTPSKDVVLETTTTDADKYCINGYSTKYPSIRLSISSDQNTTVKDSICSGTPTGNVAGGTTP